MGIRKQTRTPSNSRMYSSSFTTVSFFIRTTGDRSPPPCLDVEGVGHVGRVGERNQGAEFATGDAEGDELVANR